MDDLQSPPPSGILSLQLLRKEFGFRRRAEEGDILDQILDSFRA